jgi:hypothetical protein
MIRGLVLATELPRGLVLALVPEPELGLGLDKPALGPGPPPVACTPARMGD